MNRRVELPQLDDRLPLGHTNLLVSPLCLGGTRDEDTVRLAYDLGVNFYMLSGDLHWPFYEGTRRGLARLFTERPGSREHVVVAVVSYVSEPLFRELQFHEVVDAVPGLGWVDVMLAGAIYAESDCSARIVALKGARDRNHMRAAAIGATFHNRHLARQCLDTDSIDAAFIRYNPRHPGAKRDVFPHTDRTKSPSLFSFKSTAYHVSHSRFIRIGCSDSQWRPDITDHYRFVLSAPQVQGVLASPMTPAELVEIHEALQAGPLTEEEEQYMVRLCELAFPRLL